MAASVGDTVKLLGAPTHAGYTFRCWRGSEYAAGAEYLVEGDHAFTAEWARDPGAGGGSGGGASRRAATPSTGDGSAAADAVPAAAALGSLLTLAGRAARRRARRDGRAL